MLLRCLLACPAAVAVDSIRWFLLRIFAIFLFLSNGDHCNSLVLFSTHLKRNFPHTLLDIFTASLFFLFFSYFHILVLFPPLTRNFDFNIHIRVITYKRLLLLLLPHSLPRAPERGITAANPLLPPFSVGNAMIDISRTIAATLALWLHYWVLLLRFNERIINFPRNQFP